MALLELRDIHKSFGAVKALRGVDLKIQTAEVHALIGENGAGKSTLMKVISGAHSPDRGEIRFDGRPFKVKGPAHSRKAGVAMIYQELTIASHLSVVENITLGMEENRCGFVKIDRKRALECLGALGHGELNLDQAAGELSVGAKQILEIARALYSNVRVIIMDEPTSSLSHEDSEKLFDVIKRLKKRGVAVIYISHFLEEVQRVADSFTVIRDGKTVATGTMMDVTIAGIIRFMIGREMKEMFPTVEHEIGDSVLNVRNVTGKGGKPDGVSFSLRRGEIMGLAGLVGAGRTELARTLFGLDKLENGSVDVQHVKITTFSPQKALKSGLDYLSEDRKSEGLALGLSICANTTLSALSRYCRLGFLSLRAERKMVERMAGEMSVKYHHVDQQVDNLSGGNQQKVALCRLLHHDSDVFFLDEPTRGVDVGSKAEIYRIMLELAAKGKSIVFISSYLPELLGVCDTLAVMRRGEMSEVKPTEEWSEDSIMEYATLTG